MRKKRVMIVDGEIRSRRLIGRAIDLEESLELVGTCSSSEFALEKIDRLQPDFVVIGISGSHMEGLETLARIRNARTDVPIIVAGSHARRGTPFALEALSAGAAGCISLTLHSDSIDESTIDVLRMDLLSIVHKVFPDAHGIGGGTPIAEMTFLKNELSDESKRPIEAVVIGVSTGGPNALAATIPAFPIDFPVPVLIVQHMPEYFIPSLAERLDSLGTLPVRVAVAGAEARPGTAWLAPWGVHLELKRDFRGLRLAFNDGPEENLCRPSVDVLFRSAAKVLNGRVLGVVLTGMGCDGLRGCRDVRAAGGIVIVQDELTSVIKGGMRGSVAEAGLAHKILPLSEIGPEIVRIARSGRSPLPGS